MFLISAVAMGMVGFVWFKVRRARKGTLPSA